MKCLEKKLPGNYITMVHAVLNISQKQHPTKQQLYDHFIPISQTIQVRKTRHAWYWWRIKAQLIRGILLWTPTPVLADQ